MIKTTGLYHAGIPVDDLERAERFYTEFLGMQVVQRVDSPRTRFIGLHCGEGDREVNVTIFERPRPLDRNTLQNGDGIAHDAFWVAAEDFDAAVAALKREGYYHKGPYDRPQGRRTVYFFDSEGNYLELYQR